MSAPMASATHRSLGRRVRLLGSELRSAAEPRLAHGAARLVAGLLRPSPAAVRRGGAAFVLAGGAGALGAWRAPSVAGWCLAFTAAGMVVMAAGLTWRIPRVVAAGVVVIALGVGLSAVTRSAADPYAAVEGAALLSGAELAWWALETWIPIAAEAGVDRPRWWLLIALPAAGLGVGLAVIALAGDRAVTASGFDGATVEAVGAAGVVLFAGLVAVGRRLGQ